MQHTLSALLLPALLPLALAQDNEAEKLFRDMEKKITAAKAFQVAVDIKVTGIREEHKDRDGHLKGALLLTIDNKARLKISGAVAGAKVKRELVSDGKQIKMQLGIKEEETTPTPKKFHSMLSTLVTRLGVEASAMSLGYTAADGEGGGQKAFKDGELGIIPLWEFKAGAAEKVGGRDAKVVSYKIGDKGDKHATPVTVWIDAKTLLPLKRVVVLKEGEGIRITEIYNEFTLDPKIDAKAFELSK